MITVSVPGKIHLMGEHAVVYGMPALLASINKRMKVSIEASKNTKIITRESSEYAMYAVEKVKELLNIKNDIMKNKILYINLVLSFFITFLFYL